MTREQFLYMLIDECIYTKILTIIAYENYVGYSSASHRENEYKDTILLFLLCKKHFDELQQAKMKNKASEQDINITLKRDILSLKNIIISEFIEKMQSSIDDKNITFDVKEYLKKIHSGGINNLNHESIKKLLYEVQNL